MQARLESLGVVKTISQLRQQGKKPRPQQKKVYGLTPLRRSQRINNLSPPHSQPFKDTLSTPPLSIKQGFSLFFVHELLFFLPLFLFYNRIVGFELGETIMSNKTLPLENLIQKLGGKKQEKGRGIFLTMRLL